MNPTLQAAKAAISGLTPNQAPAAPTVNTAMAPGFNSNGTLGAVSSAAPTQLSQVTPELQNLFAAQAKTAPAQLANQALAGQAATNVSNAYNALNNSYQQKIAAYYNQKQAAANYQQVKSPDGGFNFFDDKGQPIPAWKFAAAQGKDVTQVLAGSDNPVDQQYINDHKTMDSLMAAWQSGNVSQMDKIAQDIGFKDAKTMAGRLGDAGIKSPADLNQAFMGAYPNVWGSGQGSSVGNLRQPQTYGTQQTNSFF